MRRRSQYLQSLVLICFFQMHLFADVEERFDASSMKSVVDSMFQLQNSSDLTEDERIIINNRYDILYRHYNLPSLYDAKVPECLKKALHGRTHKEMLILVEYCTELYIKRLREESGLEYETGEAPPWYVDPDDCSETNREGLSTAVAQEKDLTKVIVGYWAEKSTRYGIAHFGEDGAYEARVWDNSKKQNLLFSIKGKWWIKNRLLFTATIEDIKNDDPTIDKIVSITEDQMRLRSPSGVYHRQRVEGF